MPGAAADAPPPRRRRGAQPGNTNALKHGFYGRARLTAHTLELLEQAREHGALADDVALLRVEMARLVSSGDYDPRALAALARAIAAHEAAIARLGAPERNQLTNAVENVLADVLALKEDRHGAD